MRQQKSVTCRVDRGDTDSRDMCYFCCLFQRIVYMRERERETRKDSMARQFRVPSENRRTEYNWHITIFSARHQYLYQKRGIQDARDIYMHNMEESSSRE